MKKSACRICFILILGISTAVCAAAGTVETGSAGGAESGLQQEAQTNAASIQEAQTDAVNTRGARTNYDEPQNDDSNTQKDYEQPQNEERKENVQTNHAAASPDVRENADAGGASLEHTPRMFVFDKKLYVETGEVCTALRCGVMDGEIEKTVSEGKVPEEELQSNFGKGYSFQYGARENRLEVYVDESWRIFAYNENNLDGVSMEVTQNTAHSAKLEIINTTDLNVMYGEDYELEKQDEKNGEWQMVPYVIDNAAFHDVAYTAEKNKPSVWKTDWKVFHGTLKPGRYRIIKTFMDFRNTGDYTDYTLTAEFTVD